LDSTSLQKRFGLNLFAKTIWTQLICKNDLDLIYLQKRFGLNLFAKTIWTQLICKHFIIFSQNAKQLLDQNIPLPSYTALPSP
jgi:hypothetical protein